MEPMGQNLGGAESREAVLAAEVKRLEGDRDRLLSLVRELVSVSVRQRKVIDLLAEELAVLDGGAT